MPSKHSKRIADSKSFRRIRTKSLLSITQQQKTFCCCICEDKEKMATVNIDRIRNFESFSCVWLDANLNKNDENEQRLRRIINHLFTCNNSKECEEYILNTTQEKIVLIISGKFGENFLPQIIHLTQLSACYIFCANVSYHQKWSQSYPKVIHSDFSIFISSRGTNRSKESSMILVN